MRPIVSFLLLAFLFLGCKKPIEDVLQPPPPPPPQPQTFPPKLTTYAVTDLTRFSVKVKGNVTDTGRSKITEAGFVVDTIPVPTLERNLNKFIRTLEPNRDLNLTITNIPGSKTYYLRAYAINADGVGYGNEIDFTAFDEKIHEGNVTLSTQDEVVEFGQHQYTGINGSLDITGTVTDLTPLKNLSKIFYALNVRGTSALTSLSGLDSLEATNSHYFFHGMRFENNKVLKNLKALNRLTSNNGYLYIINNDELTNLEGLDNIYYSHFGELRIEGCDKLQSLQGLNKLEWLNGDLFLKDNPLLSDITSLGKLDFISDNIIIINNSSLHSLDGLQQLHAANGVEITNNNLLTNLAGLNNLDSVPSYIKLDGNPVLNDLSALQKITSTEYLEIFNSPALTSLTDLGNLSSISRQITISNCSIKDLKGLENIRIATRIDISSNSKLETLHGLDNLTTIQGNAYSLLLSENKLLKNLAGLENLSFAEGMISIGGHPLLTNFCALKKLFNVNYAGQFYCEFNAVNPTKAEVLAACP